jgi:hypothetical protein
MNPAKNIEKHIKNIYVESLPATTSAELDKRVLGNVMEALEESKKKNSAAIGPNIWRIIMRSRITKVAAATIIIIIAALSIIFLGKSVTPAYGIEQTIEASRTARYLYFKYFAPKRGNLLKEAWVEYDEGARIKNVRVNLYKWGGQDIVQVWKKGKTQQWNKAQNTLTFLEDEIFTAKILKFAQRYNPRGAIEYLYDRQKEGELKVEIDEPSNKSEPIVVTATYLPNTYLLEAKIPAMREVFFVDRSTKLVASVEIYELKNGEYKDRGVWEYCEYHKPFDPEIFNVEKEVPDAVMRIHEYAGEDVGLAQGNLTDAEIAVKLARQFFEALIAKDYGKAGQLFGGLPAAAAQVKFGKLNVLRVVSMSTPVRHDKPSSLCVPCIIEIEKDGEIIEWQPDGPFVRKVYRHAGRWRIIGGLDK